MHQNRRGRGPPSPLRLVAVDPTVPLRKRPKFTAPQPLDAAGTIHISSSHRRPHGQASCVPLSSLPSLSELAHDTRQRVRATSESPSSPQFPPVTPIYSPLSPSPVVGTGGGLAQQPPYQQQHRARSASVASSDSNMSQQSQTSTSSTKKFFKRLW